MLRNKMIFPVLLFFACIGSAFGYTVDTTACSIHLQTKSDLTLESFNSAMSEAGSNCSITFILDNDIVVGEDIPSDTCSTNLNSYNGGFRGTFDGNGYSISNVCMNEAYSPVSLFGTPGSQFSIKNLTLKNSYFYSGASNLYSGVFLQGATVSVSFENVHTENVVLKANNLNVGGFIGQYAAMKDTLSIINSSFNGSVESTGQASTTSILGFLQTTTVYPYYIGGFIGYISSPVNISNTSFEGSLTSTYPFYQGGFIGYSTEKVAIKNSAFAGTIEVNNTQNTECAVGGLLGKDSGDVYLENAYLKGSLKVSATNKVDVGGLIGTINGADTILNVFAESKTGFSSDNFITTTAGSAGYNVGGLIGKVNSNSLFMQNAFARGNITSSKTATITSTSTPRLAGVIAYDNSTGSFYLQNAYFIGYLNATDTQPYGILYSAQNQYLNIDNAYAIDYAKNAVAAVYTVNKGTLEYGTSLTNVAMAFSGDTSVVVGTDNSGNNNPQMSIATPRFAVLLNKLTPGSWYFDPDKNDGFPALCGIPDSNTTSTFEIQWIKSTDTTFTYTNASGVITYDAYGSAFDKANLPAAYVYDATNTHALRYKSENGFWSGNADTVFTANTEYVQVSVNLESIDTIPDVPIIKDTVITPPIDTVIPVNPIEPVVPTDTILPIVKDSSEIVSIDSLKTEVTEISAIKNIQLSHSGSAVKFEIKLDDVKGTVALEVKIYESDTLYLDSLITDSVNANEFAFEKYPMAPGIYKAEVLLISASDTVSISTKTWTVDALVTTVYAGNWNMSSLAGISKDYASSLAKNSIIYYWDEENALGEYWQYKSLQSLADFDSLKGYWIFSDDSLDLPATATPQSKASDSVHWNLKNVYSGWNMIANPYSWKITRNTAAFDDAESDIQPFWRWNQKLLQYEVTDTLDEYGAVWIKTDEDRVLSLLATPAYVNESVNTKKKESNKATEDSWSMRLILNGENGTSDSYNVIGVGSKNISLAKPPVSMNSAVTLSITEGNSSLAKSIKNTLSDASWDISLKASTLQHTSFTVEGLKELNELGLTATLSVDGNTYQLSEGKRVDLTLTTLSKKAVLTVNKASAIALSSNISGINFTKDGLNLHVSFDASTDYAGKFAMASVMDAQGKVLSLNRISVQSGKNTLSLTKPAQNGVYYVRLKVGNFDKTIRTTF